VLGKYGPPIHPKINTSVEQLPQVKYKNNRSFLGGSDHGLTPNEHSNWDKVNDMFNPRLDYEKMQAQRQQEEMLLAKK
jgi:hypothetical protein